MFLFIVIAWTVICACWAINGFGWPFWKSESTITWHELGPLGSVDTSSLPLVAMIILWVIGLVVMVSLKSRRG